MTPQDVGLWLNMPTARVIRLARKGEIPCLALPDGELLFDPTELVAWIARLRKPVTPEAEADREP
jgi:hypothetical protein